MIYSAKKITINFIIVSIIASVFSVLQFNCERSEKPEANRIIVGAVADVQTINPAFSFSILEGNLVELLFYKLIDNRWNAEKGLIEFIPMIAEKWEWNGDSSQVTFYLRNDAFWSDGKPITAEDVVFTFDVYSDPVVQSRFYGEFDILETGKDLHINSEKSFEIISPHVLKVKLKKDVVPTLLGLDVPLIPKHIWSKYDRKEIANAKENFEPVTGGAFKLVKWERESGIYLKADTSSFLFKPGSIEDLIIKVIPDYQSRITQLKKGEIDIVDGIKSEDAKELEEMDNLNIFSLGGREYDYIGWNHIDPLQFTANKKQLPNKLFSSPKVRKALTMSVNRKEILQSYIGKYGQIARGPVSPLFKVYYDSNLPLDEYNPEKARALLKEEGWFDQDNDGIIEKANTKFSFTLYTNSGNPRREYTATIIKNNLKSVGIEVKIELLETGAFIDRLLAREFDAWLSGWTIPIPANLNPYWNSDQEEGIFNFSSYSNSSVDSILKKLETKITEEKKAELYKILQSIFYKDEPVTFLFWVDNIIASNKKIENVEFTPLGYLAKAWKWKVL
ncbi:MAG: hypothetical protein HXY49_02170 [Ignavibacteriaceae bacterium]|nr:hypothetical protein [Ignavibacteriaceae bacterium]